jgi:hypothetical protein
MNTEKYARTCSCCGAGMNAGYVIFDDYACSEGCADKIAMQHDWSSYVAMCLAHGSRDEDSDEILPGDDVYYTEWDPEDNKN